MSDDEQGYAPAAYLEPVEGGGKQALEQQQALDGSTESCEGGAKYIGTQLFTCLSCGDALPCVSGSPS